MKKEVNSPPVKKMRKKIIIAGLIDKTNYVVTKDGRVFRELKPTTVNERHYYNMILDGVLRRVARTTLLESVSNG
jgi:hypothetical protein